MNLTKVLRNQGYDLIDAPIRNHKLLQLWLKKPANEAETYYTHIGEAFKSGVVLVEVESAALNVNSAAKNEYGFNIGFSILDDILKSMGLANFELKADLKTGKKVSISYDNSITREVPIGMIQNYLSEADFNHANPALLKNANRDNILIISGVLLAKNLLVEIETDFSLTTDLVAKLNAGADGKLNFSMKSESNLKMVSSGTSFFPVAVKADRIDYDKGHFKNTKLVTDTRKLF